MREYQEAMPLISPDSSDPTRIARIETFKISIQQDPESFKKALDALDTQATNPTHSVVEQVNLPRSINPDVSRQIINFFVLRDDKASSYDEVTEQQISASEEHQRLLADFNATKQAAIRVGQDNLEAINARDAVRRSRLRLYIGRVISFQSLQQAESVEDKESILINS